MHPQLKMNKIHHLVYEHQIIKINLIIIITKDKIVMKIINKIDEKMKRHVVGYTEV